MPPPSIMAYDTWIYRTTVGKKIGSGDRTRSEALTAIDGMVQAYNLAPQPTLLANLQIMLQDWLGSKTKYFGKFKTGRDSMRDYDGAVGELKVSIDNAMRLLQPLPSGQQGIYIGNDAFRGAAWVPDDFVGVVTQCLTDIAARPIGLQLLTEISGRCGAPSTHKVVIEYGGLSTAAPIPIVTPESRDLVQPRLGQDGYNLQEVMANPDLIASAGDWNAGLGQREYVNSGGTGCVVTFNHQSAGPPGQPRPIFVALAHELIHAHHYLHGSCFRAANGGLTPGGNTGLMEEEMRTVGLGAYAGETITENAIRAEQVPPVPARNNYTPELPLTSVVASRFV